MITITDFKDIVLSKAGGKPLGKVPNFYSLLYQAMIKLKSKVDLPSAIRSAQLQNPIYTDYGISPLPSDISLGGIVEVRPIVVDDSYYDFSRIDNRQFSVEKKFNQEIRYASLFKDGTEFLAINGYNRPIKALYRGEKVENVTSIGSTTNVRLDVSQKVSGNSSVLFTCGIGNDNGVSIDIDDIQDLGNSEDLIVEVYVPVAVNELKFAIKDGTNTALITKTTNLFGETFAAGKWHFVSLPIVSIKTLGVDIDLISEIDVIISTNFAAITDGFRIDSIVATEGALYEVVYYSDNQFKNLLGDRIRKPSSDTDSIVLSDAEFELFLGYFLEILAVDLKQSGAGFEIQQYGAGKLDYELEQFKFRFPSMRQLTITRYGTRPQIQ